MNLEGLRIGQNVVEDVALASLGLSDGSHHDEVLVPEGLEDFLCSVGEMVALEVIVVDKGRRLADHLTLL